ncbi:MAG TPA: hypothetical protein PKJ26_01840 [Candidatus Woesebacteria bacterium]|jgi:O-antigen/teichoic acid export membrane protein|nr:hypothetical protein [Candidatus Woesebacteria bacterium]HNS65218.1 hypothetical protein [Candidatus Woesebacteria bacterium]
MHLISRVSKSAFFRGSAIFTITSFAVSVLNYLFNLIVARYFSLEVYGEYSTTFSYLAVIMVPLGAFGLVLIKRIGATAVADRFGFILAVEAWVIRLLTKVWLPILGLIAMGVLLLLRFSNLAMPSIVMIVFSGLIAIFTTMYTAGLQASKRFFASGAIPATGSALKILLVLVVILLVPTLENLYLALIIDGVITIAIYRWYLKRFRPELRYHLPSISVLARYIKSKTLTVPLFATLGMVGMLSVDVMLVKKFFAPADVGLYAGLALLGRIILYVTGPIAAVAFAFFTGHESKQQRGKILLLTTLLFMAIGLVATLGYLLTPNLVVGIIFGQRFISVASIIYVAAIFGTMYSLANLFAQYYISREEPIAMVSIVFLAIQVVGITMFHENFTQVLIVGTVASSGLFLSYLLFYVWNNQRVLGRLLQGSFKKAN